MNNKLKLLTIFFISLLVACTNQQESNIISVNNDFNERETNIIRMLIQDGIIINLKTTENIVFDFEIGFVHYNNGKKIKEVNVLKFIKDNENKDVTLNSYISINRIKNKLVTSLNDDGIVIFTMMSMKNCSYNYIDEHLDNGLSKVILSGRLNETTYINFTKDIEDLKNKFSIFSHLFSGIYDMTLIEGSSEHMYYIGKKQ